MTLKRVLLKISGEFLAGEKGFGLDLEATQVISKEIACLLYTSPSPRD